MKRTMLFAFLALGVLFVAFVALTTTPVQSAPLAQATPAPDATACANLKNIKLPDTTITTAEYVNPIQESPGLIVRGVWASPASAFGAVTVDVPFCRVAGVAAPSIGFEVWMPPADKWNGKFNGVGNGALAGGINYGAMLPSLRIGYAGASTDGGHKSASSTDGAWYVMAGSSSSKPRRLF